VYWKLGMDGMVVVGLDSIIIGLQERLFARSVFCGRVKDKEM
jgi:hypothetical protein